MHNKYIIGIAILVAGGLIGAALATRYYKVGPLAQLRAIPSSASGCAEAEQAYVAVLYATTATHGTSRTNAIRNRARTAWTEACGLETINIY